MYILYNKTGLLVLFLLVNFNIISTQESKQEFCDEDIAVQSCTRKALTSVSLRCGDYQEWFKSGTLLAKNDNLEDPKYGEKYEAFIIDIQTKSRPHRQSVFKIKKLDYTDSGFGSYFAKISQTHVPDNCTFNIFVYDGIS
jgi:hypothetical protein